MTPGGDIVSIGSHKVSAQSRKWVHGEGTQKDLEEVLSHVFLYLTGSITLEFWRSTVIIIELQWSSVTKHSIPSFIFIFRDAAGK